MNDLCRSCYACKRIAYDWTIETHATLISRIVHNYLTQSYIPEHRADEFSHMHICGDRSPIGIAN